MTSWELSPLYRHAHTLALAHSDRLVSLHRDRLVLRDAHSLAPVRSWTLPAIPAPLTTLAASPSSDLILVCAAKQRTAWVIDPDTDGELARIEVGNEGCVAMAWASTPNPTVMAWAAHHLHLSLFPLPSSSNPPLQPFRILSPKHSPSSSSSTTTGCSFHPQGKFLAVLERHQARDVIGVYSTGANTGEWALVKSITLPDPNSDLADLAWSPCGRYIAAWSSITDYTVHVFTPTGTLLATYTPYSSLSSPHASSPSSAPTSSSSSRAPKPTPPTPSTTGGPKSRSRLERSTKDYVGLGVRCVVWGRDGEWLIVGGWDGKVRVLTRHGWHAVAELAIPQRVTEPVNAWREPANWVLNTRGRGILSYEPLALPHSLSPLPSDFARPNPRMGVERVVQSENGRWVAVLNASYPLVIAIFDFSALLALTSSSSSSNNNNADSDESPTRPTLHTLLLLSPSSSSATLTPDLALDLAWQPSRGEQEQVLCWTSGEKGFGIWASPASSSSSRGTAECVGIPARGDFSARTLAFAPDGEALVLSSTTSQTTAEGTFCVAYPVYEGDEVHVPSRGGADDSHGGGGRSWVEDDD